MLDSSADYSGVISALQSCFSGRVKSTKSMKVKVQKNFHMVRVGSLPTIWEKVTADAGIPPLLALEFQSVSRHLFNYMMVEYFKAEHTQGSDTHEVTLLAEEENIVRYASGYVAMKLGKKFKKQNGEKASQFMECLTRMSVMGDDSSFYNYTKQWVKSVNRGGLFLVGDSTFSFFKSMVQKLLPDHLSKSGDKKSLINTIVSDSDVEFNWCMLSVDIRDEEDAMELLRMVVESWVTMRGFVLTSMWTEEYKRATAKNVKKGKSLRKELQKAAQPVVKESQGDIQDNTQEEIHEEIEETEMEEIELEETEMLEL